MSSPAGCPPVLGCSPPMHAQLPGWGVAGRAGAKQGPETQLDALSGAGGTRVRWGGSSLRCEQRGPVHRGRGDESSPRLFFKPFVFWGFLSDTAHS